MKQDIIINVTTSETRIAQLEDDQLVELFVERPETERMVGNLYKGVVRKVMVGMSAAFVDIGFTQDAFLHFSDVGAGNDIIRIVRESSLEAEEDARGGEEKRWEGADLKVGQEILVQVVKEPIGRKGPRVSSQVSLPGRTLVLVPNESGVGVSRKIVDFKDRRRLKATAAQIRPKGFGLIVRTMADAHSTDGLAAEVKQLLKTWKSVEQNIRALKGPGLVHQDVSLTSSTIRDLFTPDVNSVVVDSRKLYKEIVSYVDDVAPALRDRIKLYTDRVPIFDKYGIETEIEKCMSRKIWLNGGGYIYFDQTEALVAIDVNSGGFHGRKDHEENSLKINLKAAREIARQLRLRDIGGIIVIDFIDMGSEVNRRKVFDEMRRAMRMDRAKWDMAPISPFGLLEMTRQRIRPSLMFTLREPCPHCNGTGLVPSMATVVTALERWVRRFTSQTREHRLVLKVHPQVKAYLSGGLRSRIARIMWANRAFITLEEDPNLRLDEFRAWSPKQKRDVTDDFRPGGSFLREQSNGKKLD